MNHSFILSTLLITSTFPYLSSDVDAKVSMPEVFADHMVLQRDQKVNIFGEAAASESVTVQFAGQSISTKANPAGQWKVQLEPMKASAEGGALVVKASNTLEFKDVLIGEVWHASGQSNMFWPLKAMRGLGKPYLAKADNQQIRFYNRQRQLTPKGVYNDEQLKQSKAKDIYSGGWEVSSEKTAPGFSAVALIFAQAMHRELKVPIGILHTAVGGTPTEAFISSESLQSHPRTKKLVDNWPYSKESQSGKAAAGSFKKVLKEGEKIVFGKFPYHHPWEPSIIYDCGVRPLMPYTIHGAIWYQGESNQLFPELHNILFPMMVQDWRKNWGIGDFPVYYVQLPSVARPTWPVFRDGQRLSLYDVENVGMAVTIDTGDMKRKKNVHPADKMEVGERLAYLAIQNNFKANKVLATGPLIKSATSDGEQVKLSFDYAQGIKSDDGKPLRYFQLAGADGTYHPAEATVKEGAIYLTSKVKTPKFARYGWLAFPDPRPNLVNALGHAASPFQIEITD